MIKLKRPRDTNQFAKLIVDVATGARQNSVDAESVNEFARAGCLKVGKARADSLSPAMRREIARKAAAAR